jgi:hypothetical protein
MSFSDSVIFVAAIVIIVSAGVLLGAGLRGRRRSGNPEVAAGKAALYAEIAQSIDGLGQAGNDLKRYFMQRYYQSLIYASDDVIKKLNVFLDTDPKSSSEVREQARDAALIAMRRDIQNELGQATSLRAEDLYKIELKYEEAPSKVSGGR